MVEPIKKRAKEFFDDFNNGVKETGTEAFTECYPANYIDFSEVKKFNPREYFHIPFLPAFHRPGWMVRYFFGPYDAEWAESIISDLRAGFTVLMTLIPQALSQSQLAGMPPIYGLYSSLLPTATYAFFGSSMQLTVGPTALISLMTGSLLTQYGVDPSEDIELAVDTCAQAAFCVGIVIMGLGLLNMGHLINFISHPVMAGFTTGAALTIGLTQLRASTGFSLVPPQVGDGETESQYEVMKWWSDNWDGVDAKGHQYRNHYAVKICFGLYVPLMLLQLFKWNYKFSPETKKTWQFKTWEFVYAVLPLIAVIIGGNIAWRIKKSDHFNEKGYKHSFYAKGLKIVGIVPDGIDILRTPKFRHEWGQFFIDVIPITLIAFMESYSIARNIGGQTNTLHFLNASQEMFANGVANLLGCVSSCYPVSGSFSRSALNAACGARTPLSKCVGIIGVIIVLTRLTDALQYIPQAALSAIIFVAIANLIHFSDFWHFWKYSKKDFFTALVTLIFSFVFDTSVGLAVGLGTSFAVYIFFDIIMDKSHSPRLFSSSKEGQEVDVVRLESDLNFLNAARIKDFIAVLAVKTPTPPVDVPKNVYYGYLVSNAFDQVLKPHLLVGVEKLPKAIVIDLCIVKTVDISGLQALEEVMREVRSRGVLVRVINISPRLQPIFNKFGIKNDESTADVDFQAYERAYKVDLWSIEEKHVVNGKYIEHADGGGETFAEVELATLEQSLHGHQSQHHYHDVETADPQQFEKTAVTTMTDRESSL